MSQNVNLDSLVAVVKLDYKKGEFDKVRVKSDLILGLAEHNNDWSNYYAGGLRLLNVFQKEEKWEEGLDSISNWLSTVPLDQHLIIGKLLFRKGKFQAALNLNYLAISSYQQAVDEFIEAGDMKSIAYSHLVLAIQYARIHDYKLSRAHAKKALESLPDKPKYANKKNEINELIAQTYLWEENPEKAIEHLVDHQKKVGSYNEAQSLLASFYVHFGEYEKAEHILNSLQDLSLLSRIDVLESKRLLAEKQGKLGKAIDYQKTLCKLMPQYYSKREYFRELAKLANIYYDNNELHNANLIVDSILTFSAIDFNQPNLLTENNLDRIELFTAEALYLKGRILIDSNSNQKGTKVSEKALRCVESALKILDKKRQYISNNHEKIRWSAIQRDYSQWIINFLYQNWNSTASAENFEKAFELSQMTNAGMLKESVESNEALNHCTLPEKLRYHWMSAKLALAGTKSDSYTDLHESYDSLHNLVREMCPTYDHLKHNQIAGISAIRTELGEYDRLIKYHKTDESYYVFTIARDTLIWDIIPESETIDSLVSQVFEILSMNKEDSTAEKNFMRSSNVLYERLIASYLPQSTLDDVSNLIIVPDGILRILSFDALVMKKSSSWIDPEAFLIQAYNISYLYYCAQLVKDFSSSSDNSGFAGFGADYSKQYFSQFSMDTINFPHQKPTNNVPFLLKPLSKGKQEVTEISELMEGDSYLEEELTFKTIIAELKNKSMIHFSIHAYIHPIKTMESGLLIYPEDRTDFRNKLSYKDILNIHLNNDLIVLSSCQSSNGRLYENEGILSLARAFIQSGSKCVIGNSWNISDNNTPKLMTVFYEYLNNGYSPLEAMRLAKIDYLINDDTSTPSIRTPHFWAGWKINGIATTKIIKDRYTYKLIPLFLIIGALGFILLYRPVLLRKFT